MKKLLSLFATLVALCTIAFGAPDTTILPGASVGLSVTFTPGIPPTHNFQWLKDGVPISGATSPTLLIGSFAASNVGIYSVSISNIAGSTLSDTAKLILQALVAPAITTQPLNQTLLLGSRLVLTIAASGGPSPSFQWFKNGVAIAGATSASYTVAATALSDSGDYTAVATNAGGATTSSKATVLIGTPPAGATLNITVTNPVTTAPSTARTTP